MNNRLFDTIRNFKITRLLGFSVSYSGIEFIVAQCLETILFGILRSKIKCHFKNIISHYQNISIKMPYFGENEKLTPFSSTQICRCYFIYERMTEFDGEKKSNIFLLWHRVAIMWAVHGTINVERKFQYVMYSVHMRRSRSREKKTDRVSARLPCCVVSNQRASISTSNIATGVFSLSIILLFFGRRYMLPVCAHWIPFSSVLKHLVTPFAFDF